MIKVSIIGCTGYAGQELTRILMQHKKIELTHLVSKSFVGKMLSDIYPSFFGSNDRKLEALDIEKICADSDVVFTALPHGASAAVIAQLMAYDVKVIDLSGDFRYDDVEVYEKWYKTEHKAKHLLDQAVYGMTEHYREKVKHAKLIGNPGCYTTTCILALVPLLKAALINPKGIMIDAKSGVSGAGRKESLPLSFCETHESIKAYNVAGHRHTSEIEQEFSKAAGQTVAISFTPHLIPIKRGILATIYCDIDDNLTKEDVLKAYECYKKEPFVHVMPNGLPEIKMITASNNLMIGFEINKRINKLVVVAVLDNLVKGAAGQAVQNMNVMFGLEETEGLNQIGLYL